MGWNTTSSSELWRSATDLLNDQNWNTVKRVIDPSESLLFAEVLAENPDLDWAWDQVMPYLPEEAQDRDALSFSQDEYHPRV